jgi:hypothetical protein
MNPNRFDSITKLFAERKLSRRQALVSSAGLAAGAMAGSVAHGAAQDATPEAVPADPYAGDKTMYLFVQTFQGGSIVPTEGAEGRYTVTLDAGTGQTIYFGDRPSRDVGVTETPQFLEGLGFPEDNPPNAALIVETEPGETDIAVVELFNPSYDPETRGVTYDVEVLANWSQSLEMEFSEAPTDLAALAPSFGTAHLLIDDCPQLDVECAILDGQDYEYLGNFPNLDQCWNYSICMPCEPYGHVQPDRCATYYYWNQRCNKQFAACNGQCRALSAWPYFGSFC